MKGKKNVAVLTEARGSFLPEEQGKVGPENEKNSLSQLKEVVYQGLH